MKIVEVGTVLVLTAAAAHGGEKFPKCFDANREGHCVDYFGAPPDVLVHVYPLEGQSLDTRTELSAAPSVRAGGSAVVTQAEVVQGNRLPPGKYVLTSRVSGSKHNWDCHSFFLQVAE